jgi:hypothetical protein
MQKNSNKLTLAESLLIALLAVVVLFAVWFYFEESARYEIAHEQRLKNIEDKAALCLGRLEMLETALTVGEEPAQ